MAKFDYDKMKLGKDQKTAIINKIATSQAQTQEVVEELAPNSKTTNIKIDKLVRYERNRSNDNEDIDDLIDSIERLGFISVLTVRKIKGKDKYEIISGHRRWNALKAILMKNPGFLPKREVPCIVLPEDTDDKLVREMNIRMNIDNVRLNPKEYREAINEMIDFRKNEKGELTSEAMKYITSKLGIKRITVFKYSRLKDKLIPELGELMDKGYITQNDADQFTQLNKSTQILFYNDLIKQIEGGNFKPAIDKAFFEEALNKDKVVQAEVKEVDRQISANDRKIADREERLQNESITVTKTVKYEQELEELRKQNEELRRKMELSAKREAESARLNRETKKTINEALASIKAKSDEVSEETMNAIAFQNGLNKVRAAVTDLSKLFILNQINLNDTQLGEVSKIANNLENLVSAYQVQHKAKD